MRKSWNKPELKTQWERMYERAKSHGYLDSELNHLYVEDLCNEAGKGCPTQVRISQMIDLAYVRGKLKGLEEADEGYTRITAQQSERATPFEWPSCYRSNDEPYPLCLGNGSEKCRTCALYENMKGPFD